MASEETPNTTAIGVESTLNGIINVSPSCSSVDISAHVPLISSDVPSIKTETSAITNLTLPAMGLQQSDPDTYGYWDLTPIDMLDLQHIISPPRPPTHVIIHGCTITNLTVNNY